jgi:hypothetical protein
MHPQVDNALAALAWSTGPHGDPVDALRIAGGMAIFWHWVGLWEEGRTWAEAAVRAADAAADARGEADDLARPLAERIPLAKALQTALLLAWMLGDPHANLAHAARALPIWRSIEGDPAADAGTRARAAQWHAYTLEISGFAHHALGDDAAAERSADAAVDAARRSGSAWARGLARRLARMLATRSAARPTRRATSPPRRWSCARSATRGCSRGATRTRRRSRSRTAIRRPPRTMRGRRWPRCARSPTGTTCRAASTRWPRPARPGWLRAPARPPTARPRGATSATLLGAAAGVRERAARDLGVRSRRARRRRRHRPRAPAAGRVRPELGARPAARARRGVRPRGLGGRDAVDPRLSARRQPRI